MHSDFKYNFISSTCFGHLCGRLQGGENKNMNTIFKVSNHSSIVQHTAITVKSYTICADN